MCRPTRIERMESNNKMDGKGEEVGENCEVELCHHVFSSAVYVLHSMACVIRYMAWRISNLRIKTCQLQAYLINNQQGRPSKDCCHWYHHRIVHPIQLDQEGETSHTHTHTHTQYACLACASPSLARSVAAPSPFL